MKPVRTWMDKTGKIAYSPTEKMKNEFEHYINKSLFVAYREQGKMKFINKNLVEQEIQKLPALRSDDPHIIALALVAKVRLLVSQDKKLHSDFKNIVRGRVYQTKDHKSLLRRDTCP